MKNVFVCACLSYLFAMQIAAAQPYIRGDFNDWQNHPMLVSGQYMSKDIISVPTCASGVSEFKFDMKGDWSENYGDNDNNRGFNPSIDVFEGSLDLAGSNIKVPCGKTYLVVIQHGGHAKTYGIADIPDTLKEDVSLEEAVAFRKAIGMTGSYGAASIKGEILVRKSNSSSITDLVVKYAEGSQEKSEPAKYKMTQANGVEIFEFSIGGYGQIGLKRIEYLRNGQPQTASVNFQLVK